MSFKADVTGNPIKVPSAAAADDIPIRVPTSSGFGERRGTMIG